MWVPSFCRCWEHLALITAKGSECLSNRHARGMVLRGLTLHLYTEKQTNSSAILRNNQTNCLCPCKITLNIRKHKAAHLLTTSFL